MIDTRPFDHQPRTRIIFGNGAAARAGELARELGAAKVLLVTDKGIVAAGHVDPVREALQKQKIAVTVFDKVRENPTTRDVDDCLQAARGAGINFFMGLGGGSSMDTAKGCNFLLTNGGRIQDYWGVGKARQPMLPLIAIPTTAGTGSECQSFALIADEAEHQKMACGDPKAAARIAILDPELTLSQPERVTACTGIDAIAHAVETAVTRKRNPLSTMYAREAFALCVTSLERVLSKPDDLEARGKMLLGAAFGGIAIENSMLGAAHAAANPLTAHFDIVHGQAVGMMLPAIVRFNGADGAALRGYGELASAPELAAVNDGLEKAHAALVGKLEDLLAAAKMPTRLRDAGVTEESLRKMAEEAARQWTATFNPRSISADDFEQIYREVW